MFLKEKKKKKDSSLICNEYTMVSFELGIKLGDYWTKSKITTKCDQGKISKAKGDGEGKGDHQEKQMEPNQNSWVIYTFKSCCLILQQIGEMRCSHPSIQSVPPLVGMRREAGGEPRLRTSPKQRATQKLRPVLPGHPGMLSERDGNGSTCSVVSICKGRCNQRSSYAVAEA